ncbi:MAG: tripartite tricarboxylate transporter TctB family protein, partial [Rhabdaerophilum sp.]
KSSNIPHFCVGLGILALGVAAVWQTSLIPQVLYATVGPSVFPSIVSIFLLMLGTGLVVAAMRGGWAHDQEGTITEMGSLGLVVAGLVLNAALIDKIGFILASTIMFALVARGFGSRKSLRDVLIGFGLALTAYIGFDRLLGYKIGTGLIERLI